jgi:ABC-2 type transport system ATP-binding protein
MLGELHQYRRREAAARADQLLEEFSLVDAADRVTSGYSGGMRRRLDLAATLVSDPEVLFLDEPTTGLDPRARTELWTVLDHLVERGTTLLLTTQYLDEAERLADDIIVIDHGRIIARGDARKLKREVGGDHLHVVVVDAGRLDETVRLVAELSGVDPRVDAETRTVMAPINQGVDTMLEAATALKAAGIAVDDLSLRQPTLDEVFLTLTGAPPDDESDEEDR